MSVETAQIAKCDRCGVQHIAQLGEHQEEPFTPPDWLMLTWERYLPGDEKPSDAGEVEYVFAFCPTCAGSFVEFAAHSRGGPKLQLIRNEE
jgi:hypothetical protein